MLAETVLLNLLGTVNTLVLSDFSQTAVAAVGAVNPVISFVSLFFFAVSTGATVIVSNYIGAEKLRSAAKAVFSSIAACVISGMVLGAVMSFGSGSVAAFLKLTGKAYGYGVTYLRIRMLALPVTAVSSILLSMLRCYGYAKSTVIAGVCSNVCNLLLCIYVIYFDPPAFFSGVRGIALACVAGQLLSMTIAVIDFCRYKISIKLPNMREMLSMLWKIFKIGIPCGISSGSLTFSQVITTPFIALLGEQALSAKVYYSNILCYTYVFSYSVGSANSLLVGRLCGAGETEHADKLNRYLIKITSAVNLSVCAVLFAVRIPLLKLYTDNVGILAASCAVFLIDAVAEEARAVSQIYEYALRATGDVLFMLIAIVASCWIVGVGLGYLLCIPCGLGLVGYWIAVSVDETVRATVTLYRWRTGKWKKKSAV